MQDTSSTKGTIFNYRKLSRRRFSILFGRLFAAIAAVFPFSSRAISKFFVDDELINELKKKIVGEVTSRTHEHYDTRRRGMTWQLRKADRYPDVMVAARSVDDVINAVKFAGQNKLKTGLRSGGHSWVSSSIRDGGLLLDLRFFRDLEIDAETKTAIVGPAIYARELATALERVGLAFPVAHCSAVPMGGYLLGGGQAWNWGSWGGAACNSIKGLDVVTAKGELIHVNENHHPDLFWAARGAGPGFPAVVTNYHLKLYSLPGAIHMNTYTWPLEDTLAVSKWLPEVGSILSDKVELFMFLLTLPEPIKGISKVVNVTSVAFAETKGEAQKLLSPMLKANSISKPLAAEEFKPVTFDSLFDLVNLSFPLCRAAADTFYFDISMQAVMEKYVDHFAAAPSPLSNVLCEVKPKPVSIPDTAYSMRRLTFLSPYSFWMDEKDDRQNIEWMKRTQEILAPLSAGHYVNEADLEASPSRSERSYSKESWQKIKAVKNKYDPEGVFHTYPGH